MEGNYSIVVDANRTGSNLYRYCLVFLVNIRSDLHLDKKILWRLEWKRRAGYTGVRGY